MCVQWFFMSLRYNLGQVALTKKPSRHSGRKFFTSREAAWSSRTVGPRRKKKETLAFLVIVTSVFGIFFGIISPIHVVCRNNLG